MKNIVFIILHYQNIKDTINCINSIKAQHTYQEFNIQIIIIDNKSPNNSGNKLFEMFVNENNIEVLLLDKNYGFSKANNIGYKYCKKYNPELVLVLNNDIIIEDVDFVSKTYKYWNNNKNYFLICPDIQNLNGKHQNPLRYQFMSLKKARKNMVYRFCISFFLSIFFINKLVYRYEKNREEKWMKKYYFNKSEYEFVQDVFVPFGAFLIYTKKWIEQEDIIFPSDTFMYEEEDILAIYLKYKNYLIIYCPELKVLHLEGRSVESSSKNDYKNMRFKYYHQAKALKKYISYAKEKKVLS